MDFEEKLINEYNQLKHREEVNSGQHTTFEKQKNSFKNKNPDKTNLKKKPTPPKSVENTKKSPIFQASYLNPNMLSAIAEMVVRALNTVIYY